tara:strand:- start:34 stop:465 length:432 start_codon:yes stop_codon:yes gene_type:complete
MNLTPITKHKIPIYGDLDFRGKCPYETPEQISFLSLLRREFPQLAEIAVHIRNEGKRTKRQGAQHKAEGMNTGASDIVIPCDPPILIELKRRDHTESHTTTDQVKYLFRARKLGAFGCYALGATGAMEAVRAWHELHGADKQP